MKAKRLLAGLIAMAMTMGMMSSLVFADEAENAPEETSVVETTEPKEKETKKPEETVKETEPAETEGKETGEPTEPETSKPKVTESAESKEVEPSEPAGTEPEESSEPNEEEVPETGRKEDRHAVSPKKEQSSATEITSVSVTLDAPVEDAKADFTAVFPKSAQYYSADYSSGPFLNDIRWRDLKGDQYVYPNSDVFKVGHEYRVDIYLTANAGFKFTENTKATLNGKEVSVEVTPSDQLLVSYVFKTVLIKINYVDIKIDVPVKGSKPDYDVTIPNGANYYSEEDNNGYYRNDIRWLDRKSQKILNPDSAVFETGHEYEVEIFLTAKEGYIFSNNPNCILNGTQALSDYNNGDKICISYTFKTVITEISSVSVTFNAPVPGAKPDYNAVLPSAANYQVAQSTDKYVRNGVKWIDISTSTDLDPDTAVFEAGHLYEVWFYLTADGDNIFSGKTSAIINGQTATAKCYFGYLEVCYTFPALTSVNTLSVTPKTAKVKYKKLKKKKQTVARAKVMNVSNAQGNVTYKLTGVKRGKSKKYKKYFKINSTNGNVTIKKKLKKGTYKVTCVVTAAGDTNYKAGTKTVTFTIKVK